MRISDLFLAIHWYFGKKSIKYPKVYSINETIDIIVKNKMSVSRFGDGEFDLMLKINHPNFQKEDNRLSEMLWKIFRKKDGNLLICIPSPLGDCDFSRFTNSVKKHWKRFIHKNFKKLYSIFDSEQIYGDTQVTRNYIDLKDKSSSVAYFKKIKNIWDNRNVIIVEGRFTRFGVGNDLLINAKKINRILCPEKDAFDKYDEILQKCIHKGNDKDVLFLIALGPTATVLASDLSEHGYQAIDVGHLDIEYEWFLKHTEKRCEIFNKYVNEVDNTISEDSDTLRDSEYEQSIIDRID